MPNLQEAAVAVAGMIVGVENVTEFGTEKLEGQRVLVATPDGYASVKLKNEIVAQLRPDFGQRVAWMVRFGAFSNKERGTDARAFCSFIREVGESDLQALGQAVQQAKKAA